MKRPRWPVLILALVMGVGGVAVIQYLVDREEFVPEFKFLRGERPIEADDNGSYRVVVFHIQGDSVHLKNVIEFEALALGFSKVHKAYGILQVKKGLVNLLVEDGRWKLSNDILVSPDKLKMERLRSEWVTVYVTQKRTETVWEKIFRKLRIGIGGGTGPGSPKVEAHTR